MNAQKEGTVANFSQSGVGDDWKRWLARRPNESDVLHLLARLPFISEQHVGPLIGLRSRSHVNRCLNRLLTPGLIAAVRPARRAGPNPRLYYLTARGVCALAQARGVKPSEIVRRNHLRPADLERRLVWLDLLQGCYRILAYLATAEPPPVRLLSWTFPWRYRFQPPTTKTPVTITLPARADLAWGSNKAAYLLLADLGAPLDAHRATLARLFVLRDRARLPVPTLVIATAEPGRAPLWGQLLESVQQRRREAPLDVRVVTPSDLETRALPTRKARRGRKSAVLSPLQTEQPLPFSAPLSSDSVIGDLPSLGTAIAGGTALGRVALSVTPTDRTMLAFLARHPFHSTRDVATALGWQDEKWVQRRLNYLMARGLLGKLEMPTAGDVTEPLLEVTRPGLILVGAWYGLSVRSAARWLGLVGGGSAQPVGPRQKLAKELAHTRGVDLLFLDLVRNARKVRAQGGDDALILWRNARECARGYLRPDGYGLYRQESQLYGFFLEYDRGTMGFAAYLEKFATYYRYFERGSYREHYTGFPTVLVVARDNAAEERIARATRLAAVGRGVKLPLLITCEWRIADPRNLSGLIGPIWREPGADRGDRRYWLLPSEKRQSAALR